MPQPDAGRGATERLAEPPPPAVEEHRHCVDGQAHLLRRLDVRKAEHVPIYDGRPLLSRQARERRANLWDRRGLLNCIVLERFRVLVSAS
jgi:hypothetical protein